jgi:hypothetical protein
MRNGSAVNRRQRLRRIAMGHGAGSTQRYPVPIHGCCDALSADLIHRVAELHAHRMRVLCEPLVHEHLRAGGQKEWWQHTDEGECSRSNATNGAAVACTRCGPIHSFIQRGTSMRRCAQCPRVRTVLLVAPCVRYHWRGTVCCGSTLQYSQPAAEWQQCYSERQAEPAETPVERPTCSAAMATAQPTGLPPYVEPCWPGWIVNIT